MGLNEKMLPLGTTRRERTGDYIMTLEVVGWNDRARCNVWAEKARKYSPAQAVSTYQLTEAMRRSQDWERVRTMAKRVNNE